MLKHCENETNREDNRIEANHEKSVNRRYALRLVVLFLLAGILTIGLSCLVLLPLRESRNYEFLYQSAEKTVDVAFIGPSSAYCSFAPVRLYEQSGITAVTVGSPNQSMLANYLWIEELVEELGVRVIVLEMGSIHTPYGDTIRNYDSIASIQSGKRFWELFYAHKFKGVGAVAPVFLYHGNWKKIKAGHFGTDPEPQNRICRGFMPMFSIYNSPNAHFLVEEGEEMASINVEYLDRIVAYCNDHDVALILTKSPMCTEEYWNTGLHNAIAAYAIQNRLDFLDFNTKEYADAAGIALDEDVAADGNHLNIRGAYKLTDFFGRYLLGHFSERISLYRESEYLNRRVIEEFKDLMIEKGIDSWNL